MYFPPIKLGVGLSLSFYELYLSQPKHEIPSSILSNTFVVYSDKHKFGAKELRKLVCSLYLEAVKLLEIVCSWDLYKVITPNNRNIK